MARPLGRRGSGSDFSLRQAAPEDAHAVARVVVDAWRVAYRGVVPEVFLDRMDYRMREERFRQHMLDGSMETHVVEEGGDVVGFVTLGLCRDGDARPTTGEVWGVYVDPPAWRRGIGTFAVREAERMLRGRGLAEARLWVFEGNAQARRFYEAMGYSPDGARKEIEVGALVPAVRYRKSLEASGAP